MRRSAERCPLLGGTSACLPTSQSPRLPHPAFPAVPRVSRAGQAQQGGEWGRAWPAGEHCFGVHARTKPDQSFAPHCVLPPLARLQIGKSTNMSMKLF